MNSDVNPKEEDLSKYFFGSLKEIYDLHHKDVKMIEFYHSKFAEVYDKLCYSGSTQVQRSYLEKTGKEESGCESGCSDEIEFYRGFLALSGGNKVLELACGSGRVTIPLALKKVYVTGVDLSEDMLKLLSSRVNEQYRKCKKYINILKDDITALKNVKEKFNLVIFPATTIRLLDVDLVRFVDSVYDYLQDGGYFIFDFVEMKNEKKEFLIENYYNVSYESEGKKSAVFFQEEHDLIKKKTRVNFYVNTFGESVEHYLSYTYLNIINKEMLEKIISQTRFKEALYYPYMDSGDNVFTFCVLKK